MLLPNQLTVLRIILTPVFFVLFLADEGISRQISLVVFIIAAITDWYDGWLARKFNYITNWGKFLDPLADKILTSAAFLAFVLLDVLDLWMVMIIVIRDFLITLLRLLADFRKASFSTSKSAQWKTFFQMVYIYYLLFVFTLNGIPALNDNFSSLFDILMDKYLIYYSMLFITIFTLYTGIMYLLRNRKIIIKLFVVEDQ